MPQIGSWHQHLFPTTGLLTQGHALKRGRTFRCQPPSSTTDTDFHRPHIRTPNVRAGTHRFTQAATLGRWTPGSGGPEEPHLATPRKDSRETGKLPAWARETTPRTLWPAAPSPDRQRALQLGPTKSGPIGDLNLAHAPRRRTADHARVTTQGRPHGNRSQAPSPRQHRHTATGAEHRNTTHGAPHSPLPSHCKRRLRRREALTGRDMRRLTTLGDSAGHAGT